MVFFSKSEEAEAVLFSPLEGIITYQGKPAAGAKLKLWLAWKDKDGESEYLAADAEGHFYIPERRATYKESALAQIVVTQEITVEYEGKSILVWTLSKTNTGLFGELGGRPEKLTCELTDEMTPFRNNGVLAGTLCKWKLAE